MAKKMVLIPVVVIIALALLLVACTQTPATKTSPSATATQPAQTTQPTQVSSGQIELKLAHPFPPASGLGVTIQNWADAINQQTNGRVKITVYGGGSMLKSSEIYDGVASGVVDLAYGHPTDDMGRFGLKTAFALPGLGLNDTWPDVKLKQEIAEKMYAKFPQLATKAPDVVLLFDCWMSPYVFQSTKKAVRVPADLKGLRVAASGLFISYANTLGAVPVEVPAPDRYTSLERGLIDGSWDVWGGIFAMKHYEVSKYYTEGADFGAGSAMVIMNKKKLESLPADIQAIFRNQKQTALDWPFPAYGKEIDPAKQEAQKRNATFIKVTPQENQEWITATQPYYEIWIKDMESRGWLEARQFLDELKKLIASSK